MQDPTEVLDEVSVIMSQLKERISADIDLAQMAIFKLKMKEKKRIEDEIEYQAELEAFWIR